MRDLGEEIEQKENLIRIQGKLEYPRNLYRMNKIFYNLL